MLASFCKWYGGDGGSGGADGSTLGSKLILLGGGDSGGAVGKLYLGGDGRGPIPPSLLSLLSTLSSSSPSLNGLSFFFSISNLCFRTKSYVEGAFYKKLFKVFFFQCQFPLKETR